MTRRVQQTRAQRGERGKSLGEVAKLFDSFRPAREVLRRVRAVPTRFCQFDHATGVGGLPVERFMLVHGPSNEGKTAFVLGLIASFLDLDHFADLVDAERTTPIEWAETLMSGREDHPLFFAARPDTYEATVEHVRKFLTGVKKARDAGKVPDDTTALVVVDSIRKLVPEGIFKRIAGEAKNAKGAKGIDGMGGRAAQIKAAMNAQWMDELVPLLEETRTAFIAIARETDDPDADVWDKRGGRDYKVGGGKAIYYDSSLVMRVSRARFVTKGGGEDDEAAKTVYGERHRVVITKTKVAGKEGRQTTGHFHTSNGLLVPKGFDRARDVVELGVELGVIQRKGSWLTMGRNKWQGDHAAVKKLTADADALRTVEAAVRAAFARVPAVEHDADGVVLEAG